MRFSLIKLPLFHREQIVHTLITHVCRNSNASSAGSIWPTLCQRGTKKDCHPNSHFLHPNIRSDSDCKGLPAKACSTSTDCFDFIINNCC